MSSKNDLDWFWVGKAPSLRRCVEKFVELNKDWRIKKEDISKKYGIKVARLSVYLKLLVDEGFLKKIRFEKIICPYCHQSIKRHRIQYYKWMETNDA